MTNIGLVRTLIGPLKEGDLIELYGQGVHRVGMTDAMPRVVPADCWNDARYYSVELLSRSSRTLISYQLLCFALRSGGAWRVNSQGAFAAE